MYKNIFGTMYKEKILLWDKFYASKNSKNISYSSYIISRKFRADSKSDTDSKRLNS